MGRIAIGYVGSAAYTGMLTEIINTFRSSYANVELQLSEMEMLEQLEQISEGKLDIGFIRPPVALPLGVASIPVLQEKILLAMPTTHAFAREDCISLADMSSEIFITPRHLPGVSFHEYTLRACKAAGFLPRLGPQGADFITIASMVSIGLGVAIVPHSVNCIQLPGVCYRPISGPPVFAELAISYRRSEPSPVTRAFALHARKYISRPPLEEAKVTSR